MENTLSKKTKIIIAILSFLAVLFIVLSDRIYFDEIPVSVEKEISTLEENGHVLPPRKFKTDGCSLWPDSFFNYSWQDYCIEHDLKYWVGGTEEERLSADEKLRDEVNGVLPGAGDIVFFGVRFGGSSSSRFVQWPWGWGYGWDAEKQN